MNGNVVTVAVIGCGRIASGAHFPALAQIEGVRVKYACDIIIEKAESMKEAYSAFVENAIADYNTIMKDIEARYPDMWKDWEAKLSAWGDAHGMPAEWTEKSLWRIRERNEEDADTDSHF